MSKQNDCECIVLMRPMCHKLLHVSVRGNEPLRVEILRHAMAFHIPSVVWLTHVKLIGTLPVVKQSFHYSIHGTFRVFSSHSHLKSHALACCDTTEN